jgi:hypothetical protein
MWLSGELPRQPRERRDGCPECGWDEHDPAALPAATYSYLLGLYLGDGCISRFPRTYRLRVALGSKYPNIISGCQQQIVDRHPEQLVRGLIHSDGCRIVHEVSGNRYVRYFFTQVSDDIRLIFTDACDQLDIPWRQPSWRNISIARAEGIALLDALVGPKT